MSHAVQGHQDRQVIVKRSDKLWSIGGVNSNPLQYSCHKNPMNSMKKQKDMTLENEPPQVLKVSNMLLGKSGGQLLIAPERMKRLGQSRNDTQLWMCLVVKVKSNAIKNNIAWASLVAQMLKNLPAVRETWVQSLVWEDPLEQGMTAHSSILAWRIPIDRGPWQPTAHGVTKSQTRLSD